MISSNQCMLLPQLCHEKFSAMRWSSASCLFTMTRLIKTAQHITTFVTLFIQVSCLHTMLSALISVALVVLLLICQASFCAVELIAFLKTYIGNRGLSSYIDCHEYEQVEELGCSGRNWGLLDIESSTLTFQVDKKPAFRVPLKDVGQVQQVQPFTLLSNSSIRAAGKAGVCGPDTCCIIPDISQLFGKRNWVTATLALSWPLGL